MTVITPATLQNNTQAGVHITSEKPWVRWSLITVTLIFLTFVLVMPLIAVCVQALQRGVSVYLASITEPYAMKAMRLTLLAAAISVPLNTIFGLAAAWAISKFQFKGKNVIITLIDLPFAVSPVIAGLIFVILFGANSVLGSWLQSYDIKIIFALPGIVLATMFVTFPFVARELIPLMQSQGNQEEEAAVSMGAGGWKVFWNITLPNIKWGLLYGVILCNARAMGEFGAVSVVSGNIRGQTNTLPLHIEILYNEYQFAASFAVSSLLVMLAVITLLVKQYMEHKADKLEHANQGG